MQKRASIRYEVFIKADIETIWEMIGDPLAISRWFVGIASATLEGTTRVIVLGSGLSLPETIVTIDPVAHRFQYRIIAPIVKEHLSTIDVIEVDEERSLVIYSVDAEPANFGLIIGGAAGAALENLREILEDKNTKGEV
ncbi:MULTISPECIES: SRPBCC family protein [Acidithrix]|uniref:Polyketide cyclase / dehydrase and lipid transport n=1 Tax=Acidithrix ferrooxidans TaxID=1280514 RepID=A0A0D8HES0_9ACTN|nr:MULTISPECIES: SRPBCC family protein [Acidithrix]KJF16312.1 polyketide cyclase / dehydrase and lipid transport [Acidithrix ferrooxidans]CAG4922956.1 unnamed protein product [Acidithrix sp. C25]